jgi:hypothetical protein
VTYPNNTQVRLSWSGGPWTQAFGGGCTPATHYLVNSGCATNSTVLWSTGSSPITRAWVGPFEEGFIVTEDAGRGASGASGWQTPKNAAGVLITCTTTPCPPDNSPTGTRTVAIGAGTGAVHVTGSINRASAWDHTAYTTTPLSITGSGASRVITAGVIVVEDNLTQEVFTTTFNNPLTHMANCAFPVSGTVTTTIASSGADNGVVETITFTGTCGVATRSRTDGTATTLYLSLVL